ncbi:glycosyltransferase family 4 protein [Patescibacteria group bacterium]|nr:glycosyltransferase family 4 protein [Patescibacteria group bacterium]
MAKTIICVATPLYAPEIGGPATHVGLLEHNLPRDRYEVRIVKFGDVRHLPKIIRHIVYMGKLIRAAKTARFIYALDPVSVGFPAFIVSRILGKPMLLRVGGDYAWEQGVQRFGVNETLDEFIERRQFSSQVKTLQSLQSYVAVNAHSVIAPSEYLASIINRWGVPKSRIKVIYSQPELGDTILSRSEARKQLNIHEDEELVLSAGRIVPWKGFEGLVDAVTKVREVRVPRLYIAGDGPGKATLEAHVQKAGANGYVSLLGQLSNQQLSVWIAAADVVVLNTKYEGLSHFLLEAFAARTPVITTPVGGNTELITDGDTGLLVPQNDISALSNAITHVLTDRKFAAALAERAAESLSRFNKDKALEKLDSLFKSL